MSDPQQPEQRRSDKGGATPRDSAELKASQTQAKGGRAHGTDKGDKGGGKSGGVPPDQQTEHPLTGDSCL
ncbi:hypothetical protein ABTY98_20365 [Streptomyces sp. NPDC096040]|uniref:hypothetical protein n=1 Tax=Streptomyces sp. NPDC096040 TaxID=3155541 RepID=UPI00332DC20B